MKYLLAALCFISVSFINLNAFAYKDVAAVPRRGHDPLVTMDEARDILPPGSFFGQREVEITFGIRFTAQEKERIYRLPFRESELRRCDDCALFLAVPRFGSSNRPTDIGSLLKSSNFGRQFNDSRILPWFKNESFAVRPLELRWHLVKIRLEGKGAKLVDQDYRLSARERIAPANLYVYMMLTSPRLFRGEYVFTSDTAYGGSKSVIVGREDENGRIGIDTVAKEFVVRSNLGRAVEILPSRR